MSLNIRTGAPTLDGCTMSAFSSDAADVVVSIYNGATLVDTVTITPMAKIGGDRDMTTPPPDGLDYAGYIGEAPVTGLEVFTEYTFSATNGIETIGVDQATDPHGFMTAMQRGADFAIGFTTCMSGAGGSRSAYDFLNWYIDNGPVPLFAVVHPDDVAYADNPAQITLANGSLSKAYDATADDREYNWCLKYMALYGCLTDGGTTIAAFNTTSYQRVLNTCHFLPQAGDHEYLNDIWEKVASYPNPLMLSAGVYDGPARVAWNAFMAPLMGNRLGVVNPESHHWELTLGDLQIVAPDIISNTAATGTPGLSGTITSLLGSDQIAELLTAMNNTVPFKILANPAFNVRGDGVNYGYKPSVTYSAAVTAERDRLLLDDAATPKSVMNNPRTNGTLGSFVMIRGDAHGDPCYYFSNPAAAGVLAEGYHDICLVAAGGPAGGTSRGSYNFTDYTDPGNWPYVDGYPGTQFSGGCLQFSNQHEVCVIVEVYGSRNPPEMIVRRYDRDQRENATYGAAFSNNLQFMKGAVAPEVNEGYLISFEKKFCQYQGNFGFEVADETWSAPKFAAAGD